MAERLWYQYDDRRESAQAMTNAARALYMDQGDRRRRDADDAMTLWSGSLNHGFAGANPLSILGLIDNTSGYNVVQAITNTMTNTVLRNEVRPLLITEGGDSEMRDKVEAMQEAADGQAYSLGLHGELGEVACWNGFIFGNGGVEWWADCSNSRILGTPTYHWQYYVSRQEMRYSLLPQQLFSRHVMPRDVLLEFIGDDDKDAMEAVKSAPTASMADTRDFDPSEPGKVVDLVVIWKGWHLPSSRVDMKDPRAFGRTDSGRTGKANHDGAHMVCVEGGNKPLVPLIARPWPYDYYPISWFRPYRIPGSFWGRGIPEIVARSQIEMNQWNERIYQVLDRLAVPTVILPDGAGINPAQIDNSLAKILKMKGGNGNAPTIWNPSAVPQDLIARLDRLPQQVRDQMGMSEMSMAARKPTGVDHKPGLAYLANTETIRHTSEFKAWERFMLDSYRNILRCFKELSEHDEDFELVYEQDEQLIRSKFTSIDVDSSKYRIKAKATNLFSQDPAQQADQIADLVDRQLLPPDSLFDAIKSPDLQKLADNRRVMRQNAVARVKAVIRGPYNEDLMPMPWNDLQTMEQEALKAINQLELNGDKQEKIDRLERFMKDVRVLMPPPQPAAPPVPAPMDPAAMGGPAGQAPAVAMPPPPMPANQPM